MEISVVIPCHNAGRWIASALRSVAQQTYPAREIIVINDRSTDDLLAQIEESGVPVKLLHVDAGNAAVARNAGIEVAKGDWIALLDADDVWYPNHLARAAGLLSKTHDVAFMSNHDWIGLHDELLPVPEEFRCKLTAPCSGMDVEQFFQLTDNGFHFGHSTVLYRLDRVRAAGMFDPSQRRRHDSDLWIRMIADQTWTYDTVESGRLPREHARQPVQLPRRSAITSTLRALGEERRPGTLTPNDREHLARASAARDGHRVSSRAPAEHDARIRDLARGRISRAKYRIYLIGAHRRGRAWRVG